MRYKWYHECPKPSMDLGYEEVEVERGWWIFKRTVTERYPIWETKTVEWVCSGCRAEWVYHGSYAHKYTPGIWRCRFRPEIWKDYE